MNKLDKTGTLDSKSKTPKSDTAKATSIQNTGDSSPLNDTEQQLFAEGETDIQENLRGTFILGWRLEQIRDQKLYRGNYKTFEAYCRKRWDFSKTHANRHIQAYLCEKHLKGVKGTQVYVPDKESQFRMIADLKPAQWVEVAAKVREAVGENNATAGDFGAARQELFPKPKREAKVAAPATESTPSPKPVVKPEFDTKLVSFAELKGMADKAYIFCGTKSQEALKIIGKLQRHLDEWSDWQKKQEVV